jgi:methionyl-tRNA formyltransferase
VRIAFLGSGAFGLPSIQRLAGAHQLVAIATQPDRPAGRKQALTPTPIGAWAAGHAPDVPLFKPENINDPAERDRFRAIDADAWVVIAYGQYLSTRLLADRFAFNLHGSLLPRWRGAAPIHHAVLAGDTVTGNSIITLARQMDAGDVLASASRPIAPTDITGELHDALALDGAELVMRVLDQLAAGAISRTPQDESLVTLAPKLGRADAVVRWDAPANAVRCQINGLSPWPGVAVGFRELRLKLHRAAPDNASDPAAAPGTLIDAERGVVACGSGAVRLLEVQPAGRTVQPWAAFANGARPVAGEVLHAIA